MNLKKITRNSLLKSALRLVIVLLLLFSTQSCFRFRTSNKKTIKEFKKQQLENRLNFHYYQPSGKDYKVRVVSTAKKETDTAVFFVHGAPGSADNYYEYLKDSLLLEKATVYSIDRPGYGYSRFGKAVTSIQEQTEVLSEIIDSINQNFVVVVGHSYGGPIAAYSSLKTGKVKGVLMLAPAIDPENEKVFWFAHIAKWKLTKWMVPGALGVAGDEKFTHVKELEKIKDIWKDIKVPVIHVHGTKDVVVPFENTTFSKNNFDNHYLEVIELKEENHFLPWSREVLVKELIHKLLSAKENNHAK